MPRAIDIMGVGAINFPDDMSDDDITFAIENDILPNHDDANPNPDLVRARPDLFPDIDRGSVLGGWDSGTGRLGRAPEAAGAAIGRSQEELDDLKGQMEEDNYNQRYRASLDDVTDYWDKGEYWESASTLFGDVLPQTLGESLPDMAMIAPGAIAGAKFGAMAGPWGAVGGAIVGSAIAGLPTFFGMNVERQIQENNITDPEEIESLKAAGAAALQGGLEGLIMPVLGLIPGVGNLGGKTLSKLVTNGVEKLGKPGGGRLIAQYAAEGGATEAITEVGQQMLERAQAGLDVTDPGALKEYVEAAVLGGLLGVGFGGVAGTYQATTMQGKIDKEYQGMSEEYVRDYNYRMKGLEHMAVASGAIPDPEATPMLALPAPERTADLTPEQAAGAVADAKEREKQLKKNEDSIEGKKSRLRNRVEAAIAKVDRSKTPMEGQELFDHVANLWSPNPEYTLEEIGEVSPEVQETMAATAPGQTTFTQTEIEIATADTAPDVAQELQVARLAKDEVFAEEPNIQVSEVEAIAKEKNINTRKMRDGQETPEPSSSFNALVKHISGADNLTDATPRQRSLVKDTLAKTRRAPKAYDPIPTREERYDQHQYNTAVDMIKAHATMVFEPNKIAEATGLDLDVVQDMRSDMLDSGFLRKEKKGNVHRADQMRQVKRPGKKTKKWVNVLKGDPLLNVPQPPSEPQQRGMPDAGKRTTKAYPERYADRTTYELKELPKGKGRPNGGWAVVAVGESTRPNGDIVETGRRTINTYVPKTDEEIEILGVAATAKQAVAQLNARPIDTRADTKREFATDAELRAEAPTQKTPTEYAAEVKERTKNGPIDITENMALMRSVMPRLRDALNTVNERRKLQANGIPVNLVDSIAETLGGSSARQEGTVEGVFVNQMIYVGLDVAVARVPKDTPAHEIESVVIQNLKDVLSHEQIHALKKLGILGPSDFNKLARVATTKTRPVANRMHGHSEAEWTYLDDVKVSQPELANEPNPEALYAEEAVAEMFRDWARNPASITGKPASLFRRIVKFFTTLGGFFKEQGVRSVEDIFGEIDAGTLQGDGVAAPDGEAGLDPNAVKYSKAVEDDQDEIDPDQDQGGIDKPYMKRYAVKVRRVAKKPLIRYFFAKDDIEARTMAAASPAINRAGFDVSEPYIDDPTWDNDKNAPKFSVRRWRRVLDDQEYKAATQFVPIRPSKVNPEWGEHTFGMAWLDTGEPLPVVLLQGVDKNGAGFGRQHLIAKSDRFGDKTTMAKKLEDLLANSHVKGSPNHRVKRYFPKDPAEHSNLDYQMTWKDPSDGTIYVLGLEKYTQDRVQYAAIVTFYPMDRADKKDAGRVASESDIAAYRRMRDEKYSVAPATEIEQMSPRAKIKELKKLQIFNLFDGDKVNAQLKEVTNEKSRATLVFMTPEEYRLMALRNLRNPTQVKVYANNIDRGMLVNELPRLNMEGGLDGTLGRTNGHEGRHRMKALKMLGFDLVPVILTHDTYRWGEGYPKSAVRPREMKSQDQEDIIPMPQSIIFPDGRMTSRLDDVIAADKSEGQLRFFAGLAYDQTQMDASVVRLKEEISYLARLNFSESGGLRQRVIRELSQPMKDAAETHGARVTNSAAQGMYGDFKELSVSFDATFPNDGMTGINNTAAEIMMAAKRSKQTDAFAAMEVPHNYVGENLRPGLTIHFYPKPMGDITGRTLEEVQEFIDQLQTKNVQGYTAFQSNDATSDTEGYEGIRFVWVPEYTGVAEADVKQNRLDVLRELDTLVRKVNDLGIGSARSANYIAALGREGTYDETAAALTDPDVNPADVGRLGEHGPWRRTVRDSVAERSGRGTGTSGDGQSVIHDDTGIAGGPKYSVAPKELSRRAEELIAADVFSLDETEMAVSAVSILYNPDFKKMPRRTVKEAAAFLMDRGKLNYSEYTPENVFKIANIMAREALHAIGVDGNAATWYRDKVEGAHRVLAMMYPELATNKNAASAFNFILAITSNGSTVSDNAANAIALYKEFRDYLPDGKYGNQFPYKMPVEGFGAEAPAMKHAFETWNRNVLHHGIDNWLDFLKTDWRVGDLKEAGWDVSGELVDTVMPGSVIFGSKIGGGFFSNLEGRFDNLTMDLWYMRTWGRLTGDLVVDQDPATAKKQRDEFRESLKGVSAKDLKNMGLDVSGIVGKARRLDTIPEAKLLALAEKLRRLDAGLGHPREEALQAIWEQGDSAYAQVRIQPKKQAGLLNKFAKKGIDIQMAGKLIPALMKGKTLDNAQGEILKQPRGGTHRKMMREASQLALDMLKNHGIDLELADKQALIWYPEKDLWEQLGVGNARSAPTDYEIEISKLAKKEGFTNADIQRAIQTGTDGGGQGRNGANVTGRDSGRGGKTTSPKEEILTKFSVAAPMTADEQSYLDTLSEKNVRLRDRVQKELKQQFAPGGLLPRIAFELKLARDAFFANADDVSIHTLMAFKRAAKKAYGQRFATRSAAQKQQVHEVLEGKLPTSVLTSEMSAAVKKMRQDMDAMSDKVLAVIEADIAEMEASGDNVAAAKAKALRNIIRDELGRYVTRSYKVHDDPNWHRKIPEDVKLNALRFLTKQYDGNMQRAKEVMNVLVMGDKTAHMGIESLIKESTLGAKDLSVLTARKEIPKEIRELLGEYKDPMHNYARSMLKMTRLVGNSVFLTKLKEAGIGNFLYEDGAPRPPEASVQLAGINSEVLSPLNAMWTTPEVKRAFQDAVGSRSWPKWISTILGINGAIKAGKILYSPPTQIRNFFSAPFFGLAAGGFNVMEMVPAAALVWNNVRANGGTTADLWRHYVDIKLVHDTPNAGLVQDLMKDGDHLLKGIEYAMQEKFGVNTVEPTISFAKEMHRVVSALYRGGDDIWKIVIFESHLKKYMEAKPNLSRAEAELIVARHTRDSVPTYSLTGAGIKAWGRMPLLGPFVAFSSEILRTTAGNIKVIQELWNDPDTKHLARRRMVGMAIAHALPGSLMGVSLAMLGLDSDDEEAVRKIGTGPWGRNSDYLFTGRDEKGQLTYIDLSFVDPYNMYHKAFNAIMRDQPLDDKILGGVGEMVMPFLNPDIAASAAYEVFTNSRMRSGAPIFNPEAPVLDQTDDIATHLFFQLGPGILQPVRKIIKAIEGDRDPSGRVYNLASEAAGMFGVRINTFDPKFSLYWRVGDFNEMLSNSRDYLGKIARDINPRSDEELASAFETANEIRLRAYDDMMQYVNAAKNSGLSDQQIRKVLRLSNVPKRYANALARGKEAPNWRIGRSFMKGNVKRAKLLVDRELANELQRRKMLVRRLAQEQQQ